VRAEEPHEEPPVVVEGGGGSVWGTKKSFLDAVKKNT